ncbi:MAG: outer membrane protein transport protein [Myxococcales bacterium]|nr:outer membrane protein transport protein [Myxococcales bacterium]
MRSTAHAAILVVITLCALGAAERRASAGGFTIVEMGTRKNGMGAVIGRPDDPSAVYHNPAGLTMQDGIRLYASVGLAFIDTDFRLRQWGNSSNYIKYPVDSEGFYPGISPAGFGAIPMLVLSSNIYKDKLYGALSFYVPNAIGIVVDDGPARYHAGTSYLIAGFATASLAWRVTNWLSVGAGFSLAYVRISAKRKLYPELAGTNLSGLLGGESDIDLVGEDVRPGANAGILLRPFRSLTIGIAMISRIDMNLTGDVDVILGPGAPTKPGTKLSGTQATALLIPWSFHFGANWDVTKYVEIGAELRYYTYSSLKEQRSKIDGINLISELVVPKDYSDSYQVSGGVLVKLPPHPQLELMAGVHWDKSPAPNRTISLDQPTFDHLGLHTGVRYRWGRYRFGMTFAHYWYFRRDVTDNVTDPPSNFIASGVNNQLTLIFEVRFGAATQRNAAPGRVALFN